MRSSLKRFAGVIALVLTIGAAGCTPSKDVSGNGGSDGIVPLTWHISATTPEDKQAVLDELNKKLEEKIGVRLDIQFIDGGSYNDKMNMLFASGNEVDLCFTSDWANKIIPAVDNGSLAELEGLIDQYAPKLREVIPEYIYNSTKVNKKIYAIPNQQILPRQLAAFIFNDLAEKYGYDLSSIKKLEDLAGYLEVIKQNEQGVYPFAYVYGPQVWTNDALEPIEPNTSVSIRRNASKGNIEPEITIASPEYRRAVSVFRDWFKKGYIRPDVNSVLNVDSEIDAGKYASYVHVYKPGIEAEVYNRTGRQVTVIPFGDVYLSANAGMSAMTGIGKTSKHKEKAIQLIELVQTDKEIYNMLCFGLEGKHYTKIDDKHIRKIKGSGYDLNVAWMFGNQFNAYLLEGQPDDVWAKTEEMNNSAKPSTIAGFVLNTEPIKTELAQIATVNKEYDSVNRGTESEETYEEYLSKLKGAGVEKVRLEVKSQIDAYLNGQ